MHVAKPIDGVASCPWSFAREEQVIDELGEASVRRIRLRNFSARAGAEATRYRVAERIVIFHSLHVSLLSDLTNSLASTNLAQRSCARLRPSLCFSPAGIACRHRGVADEPQVLPHERCHPRLGRCAPNRACRSVAGSAVPNSGNVRCSTRPRLPDFLPTNCRSCACPAASSLKRHTD